MIATDTRNADTITPIKFGQGTGDIIMEEPTNTVKATDEKPRNPVASIPVTKPFKRKYPKVGRNELCPCGSKKKFKHCCLKGSL